MGLNFNGSNSNGSFTLAGIPKGNFMHNPSLPLARTIILGPKPVCAGLYSKHGPIVPVLVESWSGQVNSGPW